jgi:hypothetical protein
MAHSHRYTHCHVLPSGAWVTHTPIVDLTNHFQLLGHEIVLILVGFAWGVGPGFGIASAGTYLGEAATF